MDQSTEKRSPLGGFGPTQLFVGGIIAGILVLCTIGFFILLGIFLGEDTSGTASARAAVDSGEVYNPAPPTGGNISIASVGDTDYVRGNKKAKVTIVEYSDYECPFCARFHDTMKQVIDKYGDDVNWVYRHFPLTSIHQHATRFALAAECAGEQDKFWEMSDKIIENQTGGSADATLEGYAKVLGLNTSKFLECVSSEKYLSKVQAQSQEAQRAGGQGTPYSVILGPNGETVPLSGAQPFSAVESAIQQFIN